ncbi:DHA2 family multidrug resistance protein-like MFS transporter [Caulobacter sp. BE264]|uniref:MFS transporter n=1 Tax=Caulobacter sp. BE264 TaxID=2817724 RepID=UPI00285B20C9|nr:MFS transporter [Caulobacter sp. BE264]MDR7230298.1 DHA2 family multidrug resistance protein-like MFS transporter [Caulobacter sp. BE264]
MIWTLGKRLAIGSVLAALVLVVLDAAIVNVALPTLSRSLHVTAAASVLVVTAYQAALVMALLPCAALGESLGYRRVFIGGLALFTLASGLCATAPTLSWLVAARFAQGLGASAVMALGVALLRTVVPPEKLGDAIGWNALVIALTSAAGPSVGALVLSYTSWPWLFALNLPIGVLVLGAACALPAKPGSSRGLDLVSIALNMTAFALLIAGAEALSRQPVIAAMLLTGGALSFRSLLQRERPKASPLIPLDLLQAPSFRLSVIASICCFTGQAAGLVALPFYLQHVLGLTPLATGLYITPWSLMVAVSATFAGRLASPGSTAWLCAAGCALLSAGLFAASAWPLAGAPVTVMPMVMLCGLGFGLFQVTNNRNMFLSAPQARSGAAGGLQGMARLTGQTTGVLVMTLLFNAAPVEIAPRIGLAVGAVLTLAAGLLSTLHSPRSRPRPA